MQFEKFETVDKVIAGICIFGILYIIAQIIRAIL